MTNKQKLEKYKRALEINIDNATYLFLMQEKELKKLRKENKKIQEELKELKVRFEKINNERFRKNE